jgi:2,4-dienoyl-CoA reductase-like NADH-dependent reductase (Old Yellow Enzyme family)
VNHAASRLKRALSPIRVGPVTVKNRIVRAAHGTKLGDGGVTDRMIAYHLERAQGGVGLTVLEGAQVVSGGAAGGGLMVWNDAIVPTYRRLMSAINPTGMKVFQQLWHGGAVYADWRQPPQAPSALPSMAAGVPARALSVREIQDVINAFAQAARRCEEGGLHGCEVAGSHGYLIMQFLSPWSNRRTDTYGGTLENRARFLRELLGGIRAAVSSSFAVGARIGPELVEGGLSTDEMVDAINLCRKDGVLDYIDLSVGGYHNPEAIVPGLHAPSGVELTWVSGVRRRTGVVTVVSGRFRTLEEAEQLIASGEADMVGMTRATIADPHLVKKTIELGADAVRPCIGCNQLCIGNVFTGQPIQCTVNAIAGREVEFKACAIPATVRPMNVLIVGGGPAGLEAARVAALAGHRVELHEATAALGGTVRLTANIPHLSGLGDIVRWLEDQVYKLKVAVHTGSYLEAADIIDKKPDAVLIACGSAPRDDGWQLAAPWVRLSNMGPPLRIDAADLLTGRLSMAPGRTVVVVDDTGHAEAAGVAEYLLSKQCNVVFVTRFGDFAPQISIIWRSRPALRRLNGTGRFTLHTHAYISDISSEGAVQIASFVAAPVRSVRTDHIAFTGFNTARDSLATELRTCGYAGEVELIGDAKSPRYLHAAIHDGFAAAVGLR